MAQKITLTPDEAAHIMTRADCHDNRTDCSTGRDRARNTALWVMGLAVTIILATVGYLSAANTDQWKAISTIDNKVAGQEARLANIEKNTEETRQDIKELLKRR
jgi:hypothetical protein